jgi:3-phenylpropionate/cinnamic acid dioxygenase small subunit
MATALNTATIKTVPGSATISRAAAEELLFHEARLIDDRRLEEWLQLYTEDALYWVPIDETAPVKANAALIYDDAMRRKERVDHYLNNRFPAQSPRSRTVHSISNVIVDPHPEGAAVRSTQVIYETRLGDFTQVGLGELQTVVATVEHILRPVGEAHMIAGKKILLINRDMWQQNIMFLL